LGISIGIGAIFFLVSLGYGFQKLILDKIATADSLLALDVTQKSEAVKLDGHSLESLRTIDGIVEVCPVITEESKISNNKLISDIKAHIVTPNFFKLEGIDLKRGEFFKEGEKDKIIVSSATLQLLNLKEDDAKNTKVTVEVGGGESPETRRFDPVKKEYFISGVIEDEQQVYAFVPKASLADINFDKFDKIKIKVVSDKKLDEVRAAIINQGYFVSSISDLIEQAKQIFKVAQIVLAFFGVVSLIVSAIGMFNTMTIALLERTQEIGIMKTLGASSFDIWKMFLIESVLMGFLGGVLGVVLGYTTGQLLNFGINILARNLGGTEVQIFLFPLWFVLLVITFSATVGLITGFYPAKRAARLNPLEALRYK